MERQNKNTEASANRLASYSKALKDYGKKK